MPAVTMPAKSPDIMPEPPSGSRKAMNFAKATPLGRSLSDLRISWLLLHITQRWESLHGNMGSWRDKMAKWERMSEEDYKDRLNEKDEVNPSSLKDIFPYQNESLGTVAGFYDFHFAQAKDDIFGTRPWFAATPEGKSDDVLAETMSKHAQWKFNQSDVEPSLVDALKISTWGGTCFVKASYLRDIETFKKSTPIAINVKTGEVITNESGALVSTADELEAMGYSAEQIKWETRDVDDVSVHYANVTNAVIDYKDIAFESTAPFLNLRHTDVFVRFRMGLLDVMELYDVPEDRKPQLMGLINGRSNIVRHHRDESEPEGNNMYDADANPLISLVEGYVRCSVIPGQTNRIHVIFSPDLNSIFSMDFLDNVTPGGILPIFPVRINKIPNRIFGTGYFEKYESPNKAIDRQYNLITYRNRANAHVYTAFQPDALLDDAEGEEIELDPLKPLRLKPDKTINEAVSFTAAPDTNGRSEMLLNSQLQMIQMRSGITSAAQGELKGVPSSNTATGTRDLQSRGATILKCPIDEQIADLRSIVEYDVLLLYANQEVDETFTWGEGREAELLKINAGDVMGIKANVSLTLTQAQNQNKRESAMAAIGVIVQYIQIPENEKTAARYAFVQALSAIGFNNAEDIIRQAAVDPAGILAMLPPDIAPIVQQAFQQAGLLPPAEKLSSNSPPVTSAANS